jgi:phosphoenolpyruvate carboxykinase (ATP)
LAGTERGLTQPEPVFSTCFAAPFLVLHPEEHADMLLDRVREHGTRVWMLNTGLVGGPHGVGDRISLRHTRAIVRAVVEGKLDTAETRRDAVFGFEVPVALPGVPAEVLDPRGSWQDLAAYDEQARRLKGMFDDNIGRISEGGAAAG